jgi:hypothetical protein
VDRNEARQVRDLRMDWLTTTTTLHCTMTPRGRHGMTSSHWSS